jgi:hypothetical protein
MMSYVSERVKEIIAKHLGIGPPQSTLRRNASTPGVVAYPRDETDVPSANYEITETSVNGGRCYRW